MEFVQVDVFADKAYSGNQLAVFPDASELTAAQMQAIAAEMNLSETTFVTESDQDGYSVRIFTPKEELPFAGHPTLGTAWVLRRIETLTGATVTQHSPAGSTEVTLGEDLVWFRRSGQAEGDLRDTKGAIEEKIARAVGLTPGDIGLEPRELGRSVNRLNPAKSSAGITHFLVPVKDAATLARCAPSAALLEEVTDGLGAYCFTATRAGGLEARGFFPSYGIEEDPGTGSAAACLGIYLADRVGAIELEIAQGLHIGRPCKLHLKAGEESVEVGGRCELIFEGRLVTVP